MHSDTDDILNMSKRRSLIVEIHLARRYFIFPCELFFHWSNQLLPFLPVSSVSFFLFLVKIDKYTLPFSISRKPIRRVLAMRI